MKIINKRTERVLKILSEGLTEENPFKIIDNFPDIFTPVHVNYINEKLFIIGHYYEQNGDLMANPEMIFFKNYHQTFIPVYYKLDSLGILNRSVIFKEGTITSYYPKMYNDQVSFATGWMRNIASQQKL